MAKSTKNVESSVMEAASPVPTVPKADFDELVEKYNKLEDMLTKLMEKKEETPATSAINRMDTPCTLIHLMERDPSLPTTMVVNGMTYYFTSFGERKLFRWSDMSNILSKYRTWFNQGIIALGSDCKQFRNEIPSDIKTLNFPERVYNQIASLPIDEFENFLDGLNKEQRVQVASSWRMKYIRNIPGFRDMAKVKMLNKYTDGILKDIITELAED